MPHTLYTHTVHPHTPRNPNERHADELAQAGINDRLAVAITKATASMWCAYLFTGIGTGSLIGVITGNVTLALLCGAVSSYLLQLVMLPVIQKGTAILSRQQAIQSDEMYQGIVHLLHEHTESARHQDAQDAELVRQSDLLRAVFHHLMPDVPIPTPEPPSTAKPGRDARGRFVKREKASDAA